MSKDTMDSHNQIIICFNMDKKLCDNNEFDDNNPLVEDYEWILICH